MLQGIVASNAFGDSHTISRIADINVIDLERVEMSAYQDEATNGWL